MSILNGKKVLIGITAGIAAYKIASLVRIFIKLGSRVKIVMTPKAKDFITPLTLSTLSKNPVNSSFFNKIENENELWNNHVELGLWADFMLIAPATANTLSKMVNGTCDNLLLATYLSAKCPVYFAPSMDLDMYKHLSTKNNLKKLQEFGNILIPATSGELASGLYGKGRMAEPEEIIKFIEKDVISKLSLRGKKILVTAGPTYEQIDSVRFIGNYSSGKMGCEIAKTAANLGAQVYLILGPCNQKINSSLINRIDVKTSEDMYKQCHKYYSKVDVAICSAAVSDYKPKNKFNDKIKKNSNTLTIELIKTKDILMSLGKAKKNQFLVGFALETNDEIFNAKEKIKKKNLDMIVLNSLKDKGAGFSLDTNKVTIISRDFIEKKYDLKSKKNVSIDIINNIIQQINA